MRLKKNPPQPHPKLYDRIKWGNCEIVLYKPQNYRLLETQ